VNEYLKNLQSACRLYGKLSPEDALKDMSLVEKSSSPIDIEISMISEFYHILGLTSTKVGNIEAISDQLVDCAERIREIRTNPERLDDLRILLAEQRFLTDSLSFFLPSQPSLDFERYIDSRMSDFDISMENHWLLPSGSRHRKMQQPSNFPSSLLSFLEK
jgi:hypothetical protein